MTGAGASVMTVVGAGLVTALFGLNLFSLRNAGKLLNPSRLSSSFSSFFSTISLLSSTCVLSLGLRLNFLGPFLLKSSLRDLAVVVVVEVVGLVVWLVVWMVVRLVTVGTKGAVGGAVTSSEDNEEVSFSTPDRIWMD